MLANLLVLGPQKSLSNEKIGGAIVLFENFIEELKNNKVKFSLIDTNKDNYNSHLVAYFCIIKNIIKGFKKCDIIFINSSKDYFIFLPIVILLNVNKRKKLYLRKFGGEMAADMEKKIKGKAIKLIIKNIDGLFVETRNLYNIVKEYNNNSYWFPNVRKENTSHTIKINPFSKKFVFISQIIPSKGLSELALAFKQLEDCHLDIYGPILYNDFEETIIGTANISYRGILGSNKVYDALYNYDVLILPTYYPGEGYPGVIIEAYACGKPVITTNWKFIPEIVNDGKTGFLIEPKSVNAIIDSVRKINTGNYEYLSRNAFEKFGEFNSALITNKILKIIGAIC
jgi:glycosyltransferase involved in cell wall biosynthesis